MQRKCGREVLISLRNGERPDDGLDSGDKQIEEPEAMLACCPVLQGGEHWEGDTGGHEGNFSWKAVPAGVILGIEIGEDDGTSLQYSSL